jgi:quinol monooxygenase YgiN
MIIITGSISARPETLDELLRLSLEHVARSRAEDGCLLHSVHIDAEDPLKLVFIEHWRDKAAVLQHFAVPASRAFGEATARLAAARPTIEIFEATDIGLAGLRG